MFSRSRFFPFHIFPFSFERSFPFRSVSANLNPTATRIASQSYYRYFVVHCSRYSSLLVCVILLPYVGVHSQSPLDGRGTVCPCQYPFGRTTPSLTMRCLHSLLLSPRPPAAVTSRLRSSQTFPKVHTRTQRYCSFIQYGLNHYQHKTNKSKLFTIVCAHSGSATC